MTPNKPTLPRSELTTQVDMQGNQVGRENWQELLGLYSGFLQESTSFDGEVQKYATAPVSLNAGQRNWDAVASESDRGYNGNAGVCTQNFGNHSVAWSDNPLAEFLGVRGAAGASLSGTLNKGAHGRYEPTATNSYSQVESSWIQPDSATLMLAKQSNISNSDQGTNCYSLQQPDSANLILTKQSSIPSLNQRMNGCSSQQLPTDGFPVPYGRNFNLNSPPRSEADSTSTLTNSFQFAPVTPDKAKQLGNNELTEMLKFLVDDFSSQQKDEQVSLRMENGESYEKLLQNIVESSSAANLPTIKEKVLSDQGDEQGIYMNKTPEQKTPKRRKHRPKVVIEGKPKRTLKPAAPSDTTPNANPSGKRKYVHKKSLNPIETQQTNVLNEVTVPPVEPIERSCRRALNFDLEHGRRVESQDRIGSHQAKIHQETNEDLILNLNSRDTEFCAGIKSMSGASAVQVGQLNGRNSESKGSNRFTNQIHNEFISLPQRCAPTVLQAEVKDHTVIQNEYLSIPQQYAPKGPPAKVKDHTLNLIARNVHMKAANLSNNIGRKNYSQGNEYVHGEGYPDRTRQPMLQSSAQAVTKGMSNFDGKRGVKRDYYHTVGETHPFTVNFMGSPIMYRRMLGAVECNIDNNNNGTIWSEADKRKKTQNGFHGTIPSPPFCVTAVKDYSRQLETRGISSIDANNGTSLKINRFGNDYVYEKLTNSVNGDAGDRCIPPISTEHNFQKEKVFTELQHHGLQMAEKRTQGSNQVHDLNSPTAQTSWKLLQTRPAKEVPTSDYLQGLQGFDTCLPNILGNKMTLKPSLSKQGSCWSDEALQKCKDALEGYEESSKKRKGPQGKRKPSIPVDEITRRLEGLSINGRSSEAVAPDQHALVPYKGGSTIVPYVGFNTIKKRKPRPKVDLDPETERIWKLLMWKEDSEGTESTDKDKEKYWEEERKVFRGRADSFIARMHLVQGDRRFSQWKGSVVDSVIGVFLTQNVSDHLSSSAFMSLAARFPLQATTTNQACDRNGACLVVEEPYVQILDRDSIKWCEKVGMHDITIKSYKMPERSQQSTSTGTRRSAEDGSNRVADENIISSQSSLDSFISSSGSNSEAEDRTSWCEHNKNQVTKKLLQRDKMTMLNNLYSHANWSSLLDERSTDGHRQSEYPDCNWQKTRLGRVNNLKGSFELTSPTLTNCCQMRESIGSSRSFQVNMTADLGVLEVRRPLLESVEQSIASLPSSTFEVARVGVNHTSKRMGNMAESSSKTIAQQNGMPRIQALNVVPYTFRSDHQSHLGNLQGAHAINNHQRDVSKTFQVGSTLVREPVDSAEPLAKRGTGSYQQPSNDPKFRLDILKPEERISVVDMKNSSENQVTEKNPKEKIHSSKKLSNENGRKGKADEKRKAFDWDSLRKQAQLNSKRDRSKATMDSLNYEALRCAPVNEVAEAIKERGMNHMLAERMKDFLDRLVREHGSIDLEWLRDVPEDKVKDYLLSIRGLGLKSVECVRLLTLHHLAFPVDTNVGRIAVRLGWVPLQPLPESLQLHLLELYVPNTRDYPEISLAQTVQAGSANIVFCTKKQPNCNACPMRGECRHFASAFASARLALPGPEEKGIVTSAVPIRTDETRTRLVHHMSLPPAGVHSEAGSLSRKCDPIIEEPKTPEPETRETLEREIEDAFYEDPDEIPTIKLNIEEFTVNLQNYMQDNNMELQDVDMSKALVALNPEAASIPTPKLKNVSRLRTEHQVYELPDSHPLVQGLDKREPDDPSPYLLAIWTPGETAESVQPPENRCQAQELGKLCDDHTCFSCNSTREANSQTVRGTLLIPCRTAMRGSFPLNGTYFQVNEMFADHASSINPIDVPRNLIWNLSRRTVYFGTSVSTIFKGRAKSRVK
ncbi:hypothetical protein RJ639_025612 [Escallonia herrerae]|uniref:HhH-GPD domain-containing protein n=1 Tax=Escallonia herrerae TaxID=1293975 RepID=A0AA89AD38_9ASTE|nr:hypothetical protein RJ639_025612 [Escallonia herrerae]